MLARMDVEAQKRAAAARALEYVRPGMRLGLGTGSTARHFVDLLGERVRAGFRINLPEPSEFRLATSFATWRFVATIRESPSSPITQPVPPQLMS